MVTTSEFDRRIKKELQRALENDDNSQSMTFYNFKRPQQLRFEARHETRSSFQKAWKNGAHGCKRATSQALKGRHTFEFLKEIDFNGTQVNWHTMQMITNHGIFPSYFAQINATKDPSCYCGHGLCDANHVMIDCDFHESHPFRTWILSNPTWKTDLLKDDDAMELLSDLTTQHIRLTNDMEASSSMDTTQIVAHNDLETEDD
jgi:hypothetical protein